MANAASGNMYFIDTASTSLPIKNVRVMGILVHCTHASTAAVIQLADDNSGRSYPVIVDFEVPAANDYALLDFSTMPMVFPTGIRIKTLTNASLTLILDKNTQGP